MAESCPLYDQQMVAEHRIPGLCRETCAVRWEAAMDGDSTIGEYDTYANEGDPEFGCEAPTEHSHASLVAVDTHIRQYVLVDLCVEHGTEIGEQGYQFTCPLPTKSYLLE